MIHQFLAELFSPYDPESDDVRLVEIRTLSGRRDDSPSPRYFGVRGHLAKAAEYALSECETYHVYMGVLPRSQKAAQGLGGLDCHITEAAWLWCDVDAAHGSQRDMTEFMRDVQKRMPCPRMIVASGSGGLHLYWKLATPFILKSGDDRELYSKMLRRVMLTVGSGESGIHADRSCCNLSRVLRLPDTINHKKFPGVKVDGGILAKADILPIEEWATLLKHEERPEREARPVRLGIAKNCFGSDGIPVKLMEWAMTGYPEGNRHHDLVGAAAFLRRDVNLPDSKKYELLQIKADHSSGHRAITESEVAQIWKWAA